MKAQMKRRCVAIVEKPTKKELGIDVECGIEEMRHMVHNFDMCNETFLQQFTVPQLIKLHRAWMASGWDIFPDNWTNRQIREALRGWAPNWKEDEPSYPGVKIRAEDAA